MYICMCICKTLFKQLASTTKAGFNEGRPTKYKYRLYSRRPAYIWFYLLKDWSVSDDLPSWDKLFYDMARQNLKNILLFKNSLKFLSVSLSVLRLWVFWTAVSWIDLVYVNGPFSLVHTGHLSLESGVFPLHLHAIVAASVCIYGWSSVQESRRLDHKNQNRSYLADAPQTFEDSYDKCEHIWNMFVWDNQWLNRFRRKWSEILPGGVALGDRPILMTTNALHRLCFWE